MGGSYSLYFYFPYSLHGKERYLGAKMNLKVSGLGAYIPDLKQNKGVTIAPLQELKTEKPWQTKIL